MDAIFGRMIELSQTLGECAKNIKPLVDKFERLNNILWNNSNKVEMLPKKERQKLISQQDNNTDVEDEIPF